MNEQPKPSAIDAITGRSSDLVDEYTAELDKFVNGLVPKMLTNAEYAARTSTLMIALNRELARCAVAFGGVHGVGPEAMIELVVGQFCRNMWHYYTSHTQRAW